jgi:hypothetical protein
MPPPGAKLRPARRGERDTHLTVMPEESTTPDLVELVRFAVVVQTGRPDFLSWQRALEAVGLAG